MTGERTPSDRTGRGDDAGTDADGRPDDELATDGGGSAYPDAPSRATGELPGTAPVDRRTPRGTRDERGARIAAGQSAADAERTVLSALVRHEPGVLARVAGLFMRRQFNIESLTVGPTTDEEYARITLVAEEPPAGIEQARKQLSGLIQVVDVTELPANATERELALVKVDADHADRIRTVVETYDGSVVDASRDAVTVEVTGPSETVDAAIETFGDAVREIARPGPTALAPGGTSTADVDPADVPFTSHAESVISDDPR